MKAFKKYEEITDDELLKQYLKTADPEYFGQLYDRYLHLIYGLCLKYFKSSEDSKDATMEIFELTSRAVLEKEVSHFKSWLYVVTKNHCLMQLRKKKPQDEKNFTQFMEYQSSMHLNDDVDMEKDLDALSECIKTLKVEQKQCVSLFYLDSKSYREIESITKLSSNAVKSAIQNGKRNLKSCIEAKLKVLND